MKIVFAGTTPFSAFHLDLLIKSKNEVAAVLTQPDRKSGRGKKITISPVKSFAEKERLQVIQPKSLRNNLEVIEDLRAISPDLILVVAYGLILPAEIINLPKFGCINIHGSLLPRWRGAAPIERSILGGDSKGGITYMKMDEGLDTGPIMKLLPCPFYEDEDSESLEKKYQNLSQVELISFLRDVAEGRVKEVKQDSELATYAEKIEKQETEIFWEQEPAEHIERKIRALFPKYVAFTFFGDKRIKILNSTKATISHLLSPGELSAEGDALYVGCQNNQSLRLQSLQIEGKRPVSAEDFIKGNGAKIFRIKKFSSSLEN
jgi:methionyl-tRNA formyltransferase|tara:strand:- start:1791 stop:2747 length:957 start_codon:yes stop_codon:yes gene_type:complete